jgi:hypothetical protein
VSFVRAEIAHGKARDGHGLSGAVPAHAGAGLLRQRREICTIAGIEAAGSKANPG